MRITLDLYFGAVTFSIPKTLSIRCLYANGNFTFLIRNCMRSKQSKAKMCSLYNETFKTTETHDILPLFGLIKNNKVMT